MSTTENITEPLPNAAEVAEPTLDKTGSSEDATMDETEEDKRKRATRQCVSFFLDDGKALSAHTAVSFTLVEFYFADSNLPYDK